jgi:hypothetical protein
MNGLQPFFFNLLYNQQLFMVIFALSLVLYFAVFRKYIFSLFDPMTFDLLYSCIAFSEVVFMFSLGEINNYYFASYLTTQLAFASGILIFGKIKSPKFIAQANNISIKSSLNSPLTRIVFAISIMLLFQSVATQWMKNGIPFFQAVSSADDQAESGMNIFQRISYVSMPLSIILSMLYCSIGTKAMKWIGWTVLLFITFVSASSGAKQGIVSMVFYLSFVIIYLKANGFQIYRKLVRTRKVLFGIAVCVTVVIIRIKYSNQFMDAFSFLQFRLLLSGDAYIMGYPHGVIGKLPEYNWVYGLFSGPLRQLHIVPQSELPPAIGYELYWYHNPSSTLLLGPNSRHNILGIRFLSFFGAILYSGILGSIVGILRSGLNRCSNLSPLLFVTYCLYCVRASQMEADPLLFQSYVINVTLVFSAVYTACYILKESGRKQHYISNEPNLHPEENNVTAR